MLTTLLLFQQDLQQGLGLAQVLVAVRLCHSRSTGG
jgi:hypothetical protein